MPHVTPALLAAALLAAACVITVTAQAAPFAVTYSGTVGSSTLPGVQSGNPYSITFIMDNGSATAAGQRWGDASLTCAIWRIGSGNQRSVFTQPLIDPIRQLSTWAGGAVANADGSALTDMFIAGSNFIPVGDYTLTGPLTLAPPVSWLVGGAATAMEDSQHDFFNHGRPASEVIDPLNWGRPVAVTGPCDDTPANAPPPPPGPHSATSVPALGLPALALLGAGAAGLGALRLRRRS